MRKLPFLCLILITSVLGQPVLGQGAVPSTQPDQQLADRQMEWIVNLIQHFRRNWLRPAGLGSDLRCQVEIELAPDGQVNRVGILRPSGNEAYDKSVQMAVQRSSPLPLPKDPRVFNKLLLPTFSPQELGE